MLDCSQFLEDYSSFRDGLLEAGRRGEFERHVAKCPSCASYHRVLGAGVRLFRELEPVEPSGDFMARLQHRIFHVEEEMRSSRRVSSGTSAAFTLAIAAAIAVTAWLPGTRPTISTVELPPMLANAPLRTEAVPPVFVAGPLLRPQRWEATLAVQGTPTLLFRYSALGSHSAAPAAVMQTARADEPPRPAPAAQLLQSVHTVTGGARVRAIRAMHAGPPEPAMLTLFDDSLELHPAADAPQ